MIPALRAVRRDFGRSFVRAGQNRAERENRSARGRKARRRSRSLSPFSVTIKGTGFVVWAVCGLTPSSSSIFSAFPWSAVIRQTPPRAADGVDDAAEAGVRRLDRGDHRGDDAGVADHVRVREVDDRERIARLRDLFDEAVGQLDRRHLAA